MNFLLFVDKKIFSPDKYLRGLRDPEVRPGGEVEMADGPHLIMIITIMIMMIMIMISLTVSPRITLNSLMFQSGKCDSFIMVT